MAVTQTNRLNIYRWSSGADEFTRSQLDVSHGQLESLAAGFVQAASEPTASGDYLGFLFFNTTTENLFYCDGTQWVGVNSFDSPVAQLMTDSISDGTSTDAARADHKHGFPGFDTPIDVSTTNQEGSANTLARSDHQHKISASVIGNIDASQVVSGVFVDARIPSFAASKITSGTLSLDRLPGLPASKITSGDLADDRGPERLKTTFDAAERTSRIYVNDAAPSTGQAYDIWIEY